ncbi:unnamed protein product [Cladocopium goreaui]|uniref:Tyrosine-protein kinase ephrin type A/B receptor-like domain-containing protein n=1 Tax=Cladocopium goreaui TaxID=2562237 RepID=A0A9P1FS04_9DINO|nr:unnamed protein product [Cladocopium goreaui]
MRVLHVAVPFLCLSSGAATCLDDAIPPSERKNLTNVEGESYPLGIWIGNWASGRLSAAMVQILIEELMGFHVRTAEGSGTAMQMYAMTGCETPTNPQDRGCGPQAPKQTYFHVGMEGWTKPYWQTWAKIQRDFPATAPVNLGHIGYDGDGGQFVAFNVVRRAFETEGLLLDFYGSYHASWHTPGAYFDKITAVNVSDLTPCNENPWLSDQETLQIYVQATGDYDGVEEVNGELRGKCFSGYFWFPPACRVDTSNCVLFLTSAGYEMWVMMQRATIYNMPVAPVDVKDWERFASLPQQISCLFYAWEPDPTFLGLQAKMLMFPRYNRSDWEQGFASTAAQGVRLEKYASHDLQIIAPTVRELLSAFSISFDVVNQLLAVQKAQGSSAMDVACSWVQRNRDIWEKWLPDTTACFPQFGLFDKVTEIFKDDREGDTSNLICKACGSGSFSASLRDGKGLTYVCRPCAPGYAQPSGASTACEPCPVGEYQEEPGASSCKRCAFGQYQNATGQSQCRKCPAERTTLGLGSESLAECVCKAGSIEEDGQCVPCGIGLSCPVASKVAGLTAHLPASSADFDRPFIEHGYNSDADAPLTIYRCREHCPGGAPGTCSAGRIGVTCAECPAGSFAWGDGTCSACAEGNISLWMISGGVVLLLCVFPAYARLTGPYSPKIGATGVAWSLLGLTVEIAQNLQVVSTAPTSWPPLMVRITSSVSGLSSSLSGLGGFACIGHAGVVMMYAGQVLIFPAVIGIVLLTFGLTKLFPFVRQACSCAGATRMMACCGRLARICRIPLLPERAYTWTWYGTACLTGKFCQLTFPTMANVGLSPMMCYSHPGGQKYSLMKYSNTFCGTSDQVVMVWAGAGLLTLTFSFLALCIWIGLRAPALSVQGQGAAKFLFADFRPDVSWFGLVMLARGLLLSLPSVVVPDSPNVQLVLMHSVILVSMVFQAYFQPWKSSALNLVDTISQSLLLTLLGIGLGGLGHSESAVRILHLLGAVFCIALLVALGLAFVVLTLAIAVDKIWGYYALGQQIASLGAAPDSAFLVYLLQELTGSMQKKALQRESLVAAMDQFGTHDARMILMSLTILEMELGLSAPSESLDPARDAAFPVARVGSSTIAKRRASCETVVQRSRRSSTHNESISLAEDLVDGEQSATSNGSKPHLAADVPPEVLHLHLRNLKTVLEQNGEQQLQDIKYLVSVDT